MYFRCMGEFLVDTHTHFYLSDFDADRDAALARAHAAGVGCMLLPNIDLESLADVVRIYSSDTTLFKPMLGLHPCSVTENWKEIWGELRAQWGLAPWVAVGEIGLDFYWDKTHIAAQEACLLEQVEWANQQKLPVVLHARDSIDRLTDLLAHEQLAAWGAVFHCFTGDYEQAKRILDLGYYLGIGGVLTYKNSGLREVVSRVPLDRIVLETDAPYLAPVPFRGKRNEPSYLRNTAEQLADCLHIGLHELAVATTRNANTLFSMNDHAR